jgi:hypothetical protein
MTHVNNTPLFAGGSNADRAGLIANPHSKPKGLWLPFL